MAEKQYFSEAILLTKTYNINDFSDWLEYHLSDIKFHHIHVFYNESPANIKQVCDKYRDRVSYQLVKGWVNQYSLYNTYVNTTSKSWWCLPIDDDEYLWMKNFDDVNKCLLHYSRMFTDITKLSIRWKNMFPINPLSMRGNKSLRDFNTISNETWANLFVGGNKPVKTFVLNTGSVEYSEAKGNQTHNPINGGIPSYLCNGQRLVGNWYYGPNTDDDLKILHYQYKSAAEWIWKCRHRLTVYGNKPQIYTHGQEHIIEQMLATVNTHQ